jgi:hypothetical protein
MHGREQISNQNKEKAMNEDPRIYKLLYLWLAVSTNPNFAPFDTAEISKQTGFLEDDIKKAIAKNKDTDYKAASAIFNVLAAELQYRPGQCPLSIATLSKVSALPPPK